MGFLSSLVSGGAEGILKGASDVISNFVESPDARNKQKLEELALELKSDELKQAIQQAQIGVNLQEAKHPSVFVSGARPACIWIGNFCMLGVVGTAVWGFVMGNDISPLYLLYASLIAPAHLGLLGIRTLEKVKGVHKESLR